MSVKFKADDARRMLDELQSERTRGEIGEIIVSGIKKSLDAGVSPVKGERRFEQYKDPAKYPGDKKPKLPVNLKLTGAMIDAIEYWFRGSSLYVGIRDPEQAVKAKVHNDGVAPQPRRHFLPTDAGDELNVTIMQSVKDIFAKLIARKGR